MRAQFHHVIDIAATVLDVAGLPHPTFVNGVQQMALHGVSMASSFDDADAAEGRETQYFEMFVNRGIYHKGWTAVTRHSTPWVIEPLPAYDDDVWELYAPDDWTQAHDIAKEQPEKLHELQRLFLIEAVKYNVLPLDDRRVERFNSNLAGRPELITGKSQMLFGGMGRLTENSVLVIKNKSHSVTAEVVGARGRRKRRDRRAGRRLRWLEPLRPRGQAGLLLQPLRPAALQGLRRRCAAAGEHQVRMEFAYDGGGLAKGGTVSLYVDGDKVGEGRVEGTQPMVFSADETTDVGGDTATPVSDDYGAKGQRVHRPGPLGADRHRRGRRGPRPPDHARGAPARRDGPSVIA